MRFIEFLNISVQEEEGNDPECKITLVHLDWNSLDSKMNEKSEENLEEKETKKRKRKQTIAARALHSKNSDSGGITSINYLENTFIRIRLIADFIALSLESVTSSLVL